MCLTTVGVFESSIDGREIAPGATAQNDRSTQRARLEHQAGGVVRGPQWKPN